jgi:inorganic pyrophosphatase
MACAKPLYDGREKPGRQAMNRIADTAFWQALEQLVETSSVVIERPTGSAHPRYPHMIYPLDYGYLDGTSAMDGGGVDVWRGTLADQTVVAVACTIDLIKADTEMKILIGCTPEEIALVGRFHNERSFMKAALIIR